MKFLLDQDVYALTERFLRGGDMPALIAEVRKLKARHVIWSTVPHVTIAPIARGLGGKVAPGSRYFPFYARPWVEDNQGRIHQARRCNL